jgi:hypothetical protein
MREIKRILSYLVVAILAMLFVGCGTSQPSSPEVFVSKQLRIDKIEFNLTEYHKPEIVYHTKNELETLFKEGLFKKLNEKKLITEDKNADTVDIIIDYQRRYLGDATPLKSDSLGYPNYAYSIIVKNNGKDLLRKDRKNLIYQGGFVMNLQVIAGSLRDKKYEVDFIDALSNAITNEIENLNRK